MLCTVLLLGRLKSILVEKPDQKVECKAERLKMSRQDCNCQTMQCNSCGRLEILIMLETNENRMKSVTFRMDMAKPLASGHFSGPGFHPIQTAVQVQQNLFSRVSPGRVLHQYQTSQIDKNSVALRIASLCSTEPRGASMNSARPAKPPSRSRVANSTTAVRSSG